MVTLPAEPIFPDSPPAICATCDTEVPDYRRESFDPATAETPQFPQPIPHFQQMFPPVPTLQQPATHIPHAQPVQPTPSVNPLEAKKVSRAGLFRSLGGILAERGSDYVENTKGRITDTIEKSTAPKPDSQ
jgi:hypothetical protein